jgi:rubrerythrin
MKLGNFFYDCEGCGYTLRFDDTAQVRVCPTCGRTVQLSPSYQKFLIEERARIKAASNAEQLA